MEEHSPIDRYRGDLRSVIGSSSAAYGYTLTVWSTGSVLSHFYGPPSPVEVFTFFGGAMVAFALVGLLAFGGVTARFGGGGGGRVQLWGSFHLVSIGAAVGAAWLAAVYVPSFPGWPLGAFLATALYFSLVGTENTAADLAKSSEG